MKWDGENLLTICIFPVMLRAGVEQTLRMLAIFNQRLTIPMFGRCRVHRHGNDAVISYLWCSN